MKQIHSPSASLTAIALLVIAVLGCKETAKQPDWTKARKIAGQEQKLSHISGMIIDDKYAYLTIGGTVADDRAGTSGLRKVDLESGEVTNLDGDSKNSPQTDRGGLATDEEFLYWNGGGKIWRLSKKGGTAEAVASEHVGIGADIAVDNEKIYWANHQYYSAKSPNVPSPIYMVSKKGGTPEVFVDLQDVPHGIALDDKFVYWVTPTSVKKQAKSGGPSQVIFQATEKEGVDELSQDAENLYFGFRGAGKSRWALRKVSKRGGEPTTLAKTITLGQIAVDETEIYFFDENSLTKDDLCRVSKNGGEVSRLDHGYSNGILLVTGRLVYFTAGDDVYSFPK